MKACAIVVSTYVCLCMLYPFLKGQASSKEAAHTLLKLFGMTRTGFEPRPSQTQSQQIRIITLPSLVDFDDDQILSVVVVFLLVQI